jgi:hypothetical protein
MSTPLEPNLADAAQWVGTQSHDSEMYQFLSILHHLVRGRDKPLSLGRTELGRLVVATDSQINGTTLQVPTTG